MTSIRKYVFFILFFALNFSFLCGGDLRVLGPLTIRHFSMLFLFVIALFPIRQGIKQLRKSRNLYFLFLAVYCFANVMNGEYSTHFFMQSLYTYHAPSVALILALPVLIKSNEDLYLFVKSLVLLYSINVLFTAFEYFNSNASWSIARLISSSTEEGIYKADMYSEEGGSLWGYSIIPGIMGSVVQNGYFLATFLPVISYKLLRKGGRDTFYGLLLLMMGGIAILITQQRMAFVSLVLYSFFLFFMVAKIESKVILIFLMIFLSLYAVSLEHFNLGRLASSTNLTSRMKLVDEFYEFMTTKAFWYGGHVKFLETYEKAQHNSFLSSWVSGGVFTFAAFCALFFNILKNCLIMIGKTIKRSEKHFFTISFASASLIFALYSMTHSAGINSGSPMFWIAFVCMTIAARNERSGEQVI